MTTAERGARSLHWVVVCGVFLPLAASAQPFDGSEAQLLRDVQWMVNAPHARRAHVSEPVDGSFGELVAPHATALKPLFEYWGNGDDAQRAVRADVVSGAKHRSALSDADRVLIARYESAMRGVLRASHAASAKPTEEYDLFGLFAPEHSAWDLIHLHMAAKLAALEGWRALEEGRSEEAISLCVDTLAVARDTSRPHLVAQVVATAIVHIVGPMCTASLQVASPEQARRLADALLTIQREWMPFSDTLRVESIFLQLVAFGATLSEDTLRALPPRSAVLRTEFPREDSRWKSLRYTLFGGYARRRCAVSMQRLAHAMSLPPAAADVEFARVPEDLELSSALLGEETPMMWTERARGWREGQTRVWLLIAAANERAKCDGKGGLPEAAGAIDVRSGLPLVVERPASAEPIIIRTIAESERTREVLRVEVRACASSRLGSEP